MSRFGALADGDAPAEGEGSEASQGAAAGATDLHDPPTEAKAARSAPPATDAAASDQDEGFHVVGARQLSRGRGRPRGAQRYRSYEQQGAGRAVQRAFSDAENDVEAKKFEWQCRSQMEPLRATFAADLLRRGPPHERVAAQHSGSELFVAARRGLSAFHVEDPFNKGVVVTGLINRRDGALTGSCLFALANGKPLLPAPLCVWGLPEFAAPYRSFSSSECKDFATAPEVEGRAVRWFTLTAIRGGLYVLLFRYRVGEEWMFSFRTRGWPFVPTGPKATLPVREKLLEVLGFADAPRRLHLSDLQRALPSAAGALTDPYVQSVVLALSGGPIRELAPTNSEEDGNARLEGARLVPLFVTLVDGRLRPFPQAPVNGGPLPRVEDFEQSACAAACAEARRVDLDSNLALRRARRLEPLERPPLENGWFATEGRWLWLLGADGIAVSRLIYEVRPPDLEAASSRYFDGELEERVRAAVSALHARGPSTPLTRESLQAALGMGPREWGRFGHLVWPYAECLALGPRPPAPASALADPRIVIVTVGIPGSGKSYFSDELVKRSGELRARLAASIPASPPSLLRACEISRVNQDTLGDRKACEAATKQALAAGRSVIIDRTNIDPSQRAVWLDLARQAGVGRVFCLYLAFPPELCKDRIMRRANHPTLPPTRESAIVVDGFLADFIPPLREEGFAQVLRVTEPDRGVLDAAEWFLTLLTQSVRDTPPAPATARASDG
jgi:predicted kinase